MKKSRVEILQGKIDKAQERLAKTMELVKALKKEITKLEKEKEDAEMAELQGFMREYDITPLQARAIMEKLQGVKEVEADEERDRSDSGDIGRV